jgi:Sec-independent protein translocase protein TatA
MNLFGIGPLEILFILLLAILIFGPKDLSNASKTIGRSLNKLIKSDTWRTVNQASNRLKNLPNELMREAGIEELQKETDQQLKQASKEIKAAPARLQNPSPDPVILPPQVASGPDRPDKPKDPTKETIG